MQNHAGLLRQGDFGPGWLPLAAAYAELTDEEALRRAYVDARKANVCVQQRAVSQMGSEQTLSSLHMADFVGFHCISTLSNAAGPCHS